MFLSTSQGCTKKGFYYEELMEKGNSIVNTMDKKNVLVIAQISENNYEKITDINKWNKEYVKIFNLFISKEVKIVKVIISSDSGDYNCINTLYYSEENKLRVLVKEASFFNGVCVDGILNKKSTFYYGKNSSVQYENIEYFNEEKQKLIDFSKCLDNYECDIEVFFDYQKIPFPH